MYKRRNTLFLLDKTNSPLDLFTFKRWTVTAGAFVTSGTPLEYLLLRIRYNSVLVGGLVSTKSKNNLADLKNLWEFLKKSCGFGLVLSTS